MTEPPSGITRHNTFDPPQGVVPSEITNGSQEHSIYWKTDLPFFRTTFDKEFFTPRGGITRPRHEYYGNRYGISLPKLAVSNLVENFGSPLLSS